MGTMAEAFICDAIRTPFGRYAGALSGVRADDLAAAPLQALMQRNPGVDWDTVDDVVYGCANQAGEDNRNVGRMALLLAGLPSEVPGSTVNRLCGPSLDAITIASRAIKAGEGSLLLAGGVESMSRAPFVQGKATEAFSRVAKIEDTTIGWRFVNPLMKSRYGVDSMPETAENVAQEFGVVRADQDAFALRSQQRAAAAIADGRMAEEISPIAIPQRKGDPVIVAVDEHPRATSFDALAKLKGIVRPEGSVTAGNASGVNDGACALIIASEDAAKRNGLTPRARIGAGDAQGPGACEDHARRRRPDRIERGVRRAGAGGDSRPRIARRFFESQSDGWRDRAGPPARCERCAPGHDRRLPAAPHWRALCAVHDVHRRRPGHRPHHRTCLNRDDHETAIAATRGVLPARPDDPSAGVRACVQDQRPALATKVADLAAEFVVGDHRAGIRRRRAGSARPRPDHELREDRPAGRRADRRPWPPPGRERTPGEKRAGGGMAGERGWA